MKRSRGYAYPSATAGYHDHSTTADPQQRKQAGGTPAPDASRPRIAATRRTQGAASRVDAVETAAVPLT